MTRYRIYLEDRRLAPGTVNGRLAAVRRLAYEASDAGLLSPELAAGIRRVQGVRKLGVRLGNWLTADQARQFLYAPLADTLKGKRDRAMLPILLGCGLRRRELSDLDFAHLQRRDDHWARVDLVGKGGHVKTVPVPGLGEGGDRSLDQICWNLIREIVSSRLPGWQVLGRQGDGTGGLARCEGLRKEARCEPSCPTRPAALCRMPDYAESVCVSSECCIL